MKTVAAQHIFLIRSGLVSEACNTSTKIHTVVMMQATPNKTCAIKISSVIGAQIWHIRLEKQLQSYSPDDPVRLKRTIRELHLDWNLPMGLVRFLNHGSIGKASDIFFSEGNLRLFRSGPFH